MWKEVGVSYFKITFKQLPAGAGENWVKTVRIVGIHLHSETQTSLDQSGNCHIQISFDAA